MVYNPPHSGISFPGELFTATLVRFDVCTIYRNYDQIDPYLIFIEKIIARLRLSMKKLKKNKDPIWCFAGISGPTKSQTIGPPPFYDDEDEVSFGSADNDKNDPNSNNYNANKLYPVDNTVNGHVSYPSASSPTPTVKMNKKIRSGLDHTSSVGTRDFGCRISLMLLAFVTIVGSRRLWRLRPDTVESSRKNIHIYTYQQQPHKYTNTLAISTGVYVIVRVSKGKGKGEGEERRIWVKSWA